MSSRSWLEEKPAPPAPLVPRLRTRKRRGQEAPPLLVHSHLCWDWVWQRPQQFVARLSRRHRVVFVETVAPAPDLAVPQAHFRVLEDYPNILVLRLQFPVWRWNDGAYVDAMRGQMVREFLGSRLAGDFEHPIQWFYDPMAVTAFGGRMGEALTVYDCMDELSQFRGAPPQLAQREAELLGRADVVFTGGRRLHESKSRFHSNCHFYGCGVDASHFGKARLESTAVPAELARLPGPVLGFFGVVDERMDYKLLAELAEAEPGWSIAIIGPVLKVEPESLPSRPNLHWLGPRSYAELPACCKALDLCLMPFALNEATEYINPTKALEYMATGRPIVSTAVADVVSNFGSIVRIGRSRSEFIALCRQCLGRPNPAPLKEGLKLAAASSWDSIVGRLEQHMEEALERRRLAPAGEPSNPSELLGSSLAIATSCAPTL